MPTAGRIIRIYPIAPWKEGEEPVLTNGTEPVDPAEPLAHGWRAVGLIDHPLGQKVVRPVQLDGRAANQYYLAYQDYNAR